MFYLKPVQRAYTYQHYSLFVTFFVLLGKVLNSRRNDFASRISFFYLLKILYEKCFKIYYIGLDLAPAYMGLIIFFLRII